jgi:hypothetical protein
LRYDEIALAFSESKLQISCTNLRSPENISLLKTNTTQKLGDR